MKAFEQPFKSITLMPKASFETKRHTFVGVNAEGLAVTPAAAAKAVGVIQTPAIIGEPANVMVSGVSFIILGGTVAAGDEIEVGADGKAVKLATGKSAGICLVGGSAGAVGSILLNA